MLLKDVTSTVKTAISASSYFSGITVEIDLGQSDSLIDGALNTKGICVAIAPVLEGRLIEGDLSRSSHIARITVWLGMNMPINSGVGGAAKNVYEAIAAIIDAVTGWTPPRGDHHFSLAEECYELVGYDPGLLAYNVYFTKNLTIS